MRKPSNVNARSSYFYPNGEMFVQMPYKNRDFEKEFSVGQTVEFQLPAELITGRITRICKTGIVIENWRIKKLPLFVVSAYNMSTLEVHQKTISAGTLEEAIEKVKAYYKRRRYFEARAVIRYEATEKKQA